jgi:NAD(P)-dependent dehydrogenase (short-subunit alcohol dehydrogenase family)
MPPRHIVITGATRGLGRAMVWKFAALGHRISGCGRDAGAIGALGGEVAGGHFSVVDVADDEAVAGFAREALDRFGPPDLVLNNAALINRNAPLWEVPADEFARVLDVNLAGVHRVLRHFLPPMIERGRGVVVNFSSGWGRSTSPDVAPYCATKYGIEGLTAALAQDLERAAPGLAAVALNPGIIDTDMLRSCFGDSAAGFPDPTAWAETAVPFLLRLGARDNGGALTAP